MGRARGSTGVTEVRADTEAEEETVGTDLFVYAVDMKKIENPLSKEEIEKKIAICRASLEENRDRLIMAEIEGVYALLEEIVELLKEKAKRDSEKLLKEITCPPQPNPKNTNDL